MFKALTESLERYEFEEALNEAFEGILMDESDDILDGIIDIDDDDLDDIDIDDIDEEEDEEDDDVLFDENDDSSLEEIDSELDSLSESFIDFIF